MTVEEFHKDVLQEVLGKADARQNFTEVIFSEAMASRLIEAGEIDSFDSAHYPSRGHKVDGYSFDFDEGVLHLFVCDFRSEESLRSLSQTEAETEFRRIENFFNKSLNKEFHQAMEESSQGYGLSREIFDRQKSFTEVRFYILSTAQLSKRAKDFPVKEDGDRRLSFHIWDISRFYRMETSGRGKEDVIIDFEKDFGQEVSFLSAHVESDDYQAYLAVLPGKLLAKVYGRYGQRLLEQNVRTFLQFRGKVNKGIRTTILNEPGMFFAYNNGITATAEEIEVEGGRIKSLKNLQIVNGGQTTASIYGAMQGEKNSLDGVFVQMKLSIIEPEHSDLVVPRISEYANTQNKVNAADFFANHPFHIRIEDFSRRLWAPAADGTQRETHWFYERARGQYANAFAHMTSANQKQFKAQNPKNQMFTKTDLAKFEFTWDSRPHVVSLGAQKNFAQFAHEIGKAWLEDNRRFNEQYFRELTAKAILFRSTEKIVTAADWYLGGYRANVVTYTLARLSKAIVASRLSIDYNSIWKSQKLSENCEYQIEDLARRVHEMIQRTPEGVSNVTEWCKKEQCWKNVLSLPVELDSHFVEELISPRVLEEHREEASDVQKVDDGVEAQTRVYELGAETWKRLWDWNQSEHLFSVRDDGIIKIASQMPNRIPSDKQSKILVKLLDTALEEGFYVDPQLLAK